MYKQRSAITHIAEVDSTETNMPRRKMLGGLPRKTKKNLLEHIKKRGKDIEGTHKEYRLKNGSLVSLAHPIPHIGRGPMVNFRTTMGELLRAKSTAEIRKGKANFL